MENINISEDIEKKSIYVCKALALISIISAHVAGVPENASYFEQFCSRLLSSMGSFGVPIFLLLSGYLFEKSICVHDIKYILNSKLKNLVIPWFACGTIVWLYVVFRKGNISFIGWIEFVFGNNSYLYYMTVLCILYVIWFVFSKREIGIYVFLCIWIINTIYGQICSWTLPFSPYLNVFTWVGWFFLGGLIQKRGIKGKILELSRCYWKTGAFVGVICVIYICYKGKALSYWHPFYCLIELCVICVSIYASEVLTKRMKHEKWILEMGKNSFSLYLLHMPIAGIVANIMNRFSNGLFLLIRPFVVLIVTFFLLDFVGKMARILHMEYFYYCLIGKRLK